MTLPWCAPGLAGCALAACFAIVLSSSARERFDMKVRNDFFAGLELQSQYFGYLGTHACGQLLFGLADGYGRLGDRERQPSGSPGSSLTCRILRNEPLHRAASLQRLVRSLR